METNVPEVLWTPDPAVEHGPARSHSSPASSESGASPGSASWVLPSLTRMVSRRPRRVLGGGCGASRSTITHDLPEATLGSVAMPGTEWFPGGTLNYAEHALSDGPGRAA